MCWSHISGRMLYKEYLYKHVILSKRHLYETVCKINADKLTSEIFGMLLLSLPRG